MAFIASPPCGTAVAAGFMALLYTHSAPEARTCSAAGDFQVYPGRGSHQVYHHDREVDNMTTQTRNEVLLEGIALEAPALSHENHGTRFYRFPLQVPRLSGTPDTLPVLVPEALLTAVRLEDPLRVRGQLRSFNNRSGVGNRLVLTVYAQAMEPGSGEPCNRFPNSAIRQPSRDFQAVSRAISIISWKESCRSWAERDSPVKMWSEMVSRDSARFPSRWAVQ